MCIASRVFLAHNLLQGSNFMINKCMTKIGIIGNGFVGSAIASGFEQTHDVHIYDKKPGASTHTFDDVMGCDYIFICVPTPMKCSTGSECDLSIMKDLFTQIQSTGTDAVLIIKSTVPIGTTSQLQEQYQDLKLMHSPEFLTARYAKRDFVNADRHIVGYTKCIESAQRVAALFKTRFPHTPCILMKCDESEYVKYVANCFFACKVSFFNEMRQLADKLDVDWNKIIEGVITDSRVGQDHYQVPGHDGDRGFGGTCFPKDINALINSFKDNGIAPLMLQAAWEKNMEVRSDWDWARESSAVSDASKNL